MLEYNSSPTKVPNPFFSIFGDEINHFGRRDDTLVIQYKLLASNYQQNLEQIIEFFDQWW